MPEPRDTSKYAFMVGNQVVHRGITNDPDRREREHKASRKHWVSGRIIQVGNITTRNGALDWELGQRKTITPVRKKIRRKLTVRGPFLGGGARGASVKRVRKTTARKRVASKRS